MTSRAHLYAHNNSSSPEQNGCHCTDDIFRLIFVNEKFCILVNIWLQFVLKGQIANIPTCTDLVYRLSTVQSWKTQQVTLRIAKPTSYLIKPALHSFRVLSCFIIWYVAVSYHKKSKILRRHSNSPVLEKMSKHYYLNIIRQLCWMLHITIEKTFNKLHFRWSTLH